MGCPSIRVSFRPQPKLEDSSPLLILHKLWKGDPSIVQAHEDPSLLQCTHRLPIPLTHTTRNSTPPSYEIIVKREIVAMVLTSLCEHVGKE
jgi:hypothetical protein